MTIWKIVRWCAAVMTLAAALPGQRLAPQEGSSTTVDVDRDGLPDVFEQALLERFAPQFFLSAGECDGRPAEFRAGIENPGVQAKNGTIYGQVFPHAATREGAAAVEIHYYHLWERDCGRQGHALDAEHVSALVQAMSPDLPAEQWQAVYWYAAAHEDTVCDASHGAKAFALGAELSGPKVWISRGKHASYLSHERCSHGCGSDHCDAPVLLQRTQLINVGELHSPMNGAVWVNSRRWPLTNKMTSDFDDALLALLESTGTSDAAVLVREKLGAPQSVVSASNRTLDSLVASRANMGVGLLTAAKRTDTAMGTSATGVTVSLDETSHAVVNSMEATDDALTAAGRTTQAALSAASRNTGHALTASSNAVGKSLRHTIGLLRRDENQRQDVRPEEQGK